MQRVLDAFNEEKEDCLLKQKFGEQSIATFRAIVVKRLAADEDFAGEEGEQDAEVLPVNLGCCFTHLRFTVCGLRFTVWCLGPSLADDGVAAFRFSEIYGSGFRVQGLVLLLIMVSLLSVDFL